MRTHWLVILLVLLVGCGRRSPLPAPAAGKSQAGGKPATAETVVAWNPAPSGPAYRGRSADQWADRLQTRDQASLHEATQALGKLGENGLPHLVQGMQSTSWETRLSSMEAIDRDVMMLNSQRVAAALTRLLRDENPAIRKQAVIRLGWLTSDKIKPAVPILRQLAESDPDLETRRAALDTIVAAHNSSVPQLTTLLSESNPQIRLQAVGLLRQMGQEGRTAIPALKQVAQSDPDAAVRAAAANALLTVR